MKSFSNKFLIFDIDGVLYKEGKLNDIGFLSNNNIIFCSGRGLKRTFDVIDKMSIKNNFNIINNGATILENNNIIFESFINPDKKKKLLELPKFISFDGIKFINVITHGIKGYQYYDNKGLIKQDDIFYECNTKFDDYHEFCNYCMSNEIVKITIVFSKKNTKLNILDELNFIKSDDYCFCMTNDSVNKLFAIEFIVNHLNIALNDVVYFGNDYNDYEVFKNNELIKVYVYDNVMDSFLSKNCNYMVNFNDLINFLKEKKV